jgi:polar amino acid transport system substrate-binding protein
MRKVILSLAAIALIAAACSKSTTGGVGSVTNPASAAGSQTAEQCAQGATFVTSGKVTIGTSNPAYPPYFQGGTEQGSEWKNNDPSTGKGFESAVGYEIAKRLGFDPSAVTWVVVPFTKSFAPGPKDFDFDLNQISYKPGRAQAVDFSDSYYDVNQAIVAVKGTPITQATTVEDLKPFKLAAPLGTTSYDLITTVIQPDNQPGVYQQLSDTVAALNAGQVDGIVVDYPTAVYIADPYVQQVKNSVVVGQFETPAGAQPEYFGAVLAKGSTLTPCIDLALNEMKGDGTLDAITQKWLSEKTNVGTVPVFGA